MKKTIHRKKRKRRKLLMLSNLSQLDKLRKQIAERSNTTDNAKSIPIGEEKLHEAWIAYTNMLKENKNPAVQSFELAKLNILE
jgi:DNA polymerase-3 subunit gamma/tau